MSRCCATETTRTPGITAEFADGTTATGDVLVGADGLRSVVRRLIDPAADEPRYTGLTVGRLTGTGTLTLTKVDPYSGGTTVGQGTLIVGTPTTTTAALSGGGPVTVVERLGAPA